MVYDDLERCNDRIDDQKYPTPNQFQHFDINYVKSPD